MSSSNQDVFDRECPPPCPAPVGLLIELPPPDLRPPPLSLGA
eukprot:CAMPEP_0177363492 /NCGR_PEP_ID=MMETSP0368-20130122/38280_1 /TAXON_ID=447022 ORGANISM="Scrippsiella hangoei-like, Strain SHHI-4" /NCGR_SAMPLE_ID=MMETSP0368 /ASSEMBLY_ACC=CAM_ASM_000363 /LENGTH=41 /DNA_ID= /DNA_START= /DNA_END= /DNA_ORIENTATION=